MARPRLTAPQLRTAGALLGDGERVPTPAEIAAMTDAERRALLARFGIGEAEVRSVTEAVGRAAQRLIGADSPSAALVDQVMRAAASAVKREIAQAAKRLAREATDREMGVGGETLERWQAVMDDATCEDCEARHGSVQTHAEWEADGLPGSRNLICNGNCRCLLVPDAAFTGPYERADVKVTITQEMTE